MLGGCWVHRDVCWWVMGSGLDPECSVCLFCTSDTSPTPLGAGRRGVGGGGVTK